MYCGFCGEKYRAGESSCAKCGKSNDDFALSGVTVIYDTGDEAERICPECGKPLRQGTDLCASCGAEYKAKPSVKLPHCVCCGRLLAPSARCCTQCHTEYVRDENGIIELPFDNVCPVCGFELFPGEKFCGKCGRPVSDEMITFRVSPCCPKCRSKVHPDMTYCPECGTMLKNGPMIGESSAAAPVCGASGQPVSEEKPDAPEEKPDAPEEKPDAPEEKADAPEEKTDVPEKKPSSGKGGGRRRAGSAAMIVLAAVFGLIAVIGAVLAFIRFSPARKAADLVMQDMIDEAEAIFEKKVKGRSIQQSIMDSLAPKRAEENLDLYNDGKIYFSILDSRLGSLVKFSPRNADKLQAICDLADKLHASKTAFSDAQRAVSAGDFETAYALFDEVIPEDSNSAALNSARADAMAKEKEVAMNAITALLDKRLYNKAKEELTKATAKWPDDKDFSKRLNALEKGVFKTVDIMMDNASVWEKYYVINGIWAYCHQIRACRDAKGDGIIISVSYSIDPHLTSTGEEFKISKSGSIERYYSGSSSFRSISSTQYDPNASVSERRAALEKLISGVS